MMPASGGARRERGVGGAREGGHLLAICWPFAGHLLLLSGNGSLRPAPHRCPPLCNIVPIAVSMALLCMWRSTISLAVHVRSIRALTASSTPRQPCCCSARPCGRTSSAPHVRPVRMPRARTQERQMGQSHPPQHAVLHAHKPPACPQASRAAASDALEPPARPGSGERVLARRDATCTAMPHHTHAR